MDWSARTIQTYDESAEALAAYFNDIGSRTHDIELGLRLADVDMNARVVEIGCGDGRDAEEIIKRSAWYEGFDPSEGLLTIARKKLPNASFVKADALTYQYPKNVDVIYAFASLLHVNREDIKLVLIKAAETLRKGGIIFISLKERPSYTEEVKEDRHGKRMFYHYNPAIVKDLAGDAFTSVHEDHQKIGHTDWFTLALKKA
jgi:trans-aconitate methyltransferase